ncbi:MAG: IclR family transcriptional regulator [Spirochaetia bacterium]|nr:IclR family transcriptional regulator [Spirochaetia bacterium]
MEVRVQSLDRTFCILRTLAHEPLGLSLAKIAEVAELPRSTAFRLLAVLMQHEYVRKNSQTNLYRLGPAFIEMSSHYLNSLELKTESAPYMRELGENLGTIVFLARRQGDMMVYIDKEDKFTSLRKYSIIGQQKPLYCTSLGKALLMGLKDGEILTLLGGKTFEKFGPNTHGNVDSLLKDLALCRSRGWTRDDEEAEPGVNCVAAPIRDYRGDVISAISTSWVLESRPELEPEKVASRVVKAADEISRCLGWTGAES